MNQQKITRICLALFACAILAAACVNPYDDDADSPARLITGSGAYGDGQPGYTGRLLGPRSGIRGAADDDGDGIPTGDPAQIVAENAWYTDSLLGPRAIEPTGAVAAHDSGGQSGCTVEGCPDAPPDPWGIDPFRVLASLLGPREVDPAGALAGHDYRTFGDGQPNYAASLLGPRSGMPLADGGSPLRPEV